MNHGGRDPLVGKNVCGHKGLRNEMGVEIDDVRHTGKPRPWGGFYGTAVCPDCGEELRFKAKILEVWPSSWRVIDGKPVPPDRVAERLAEKRAAAEAERGVK